MRRVVVGITGEEDERALAVAMDEALRRRLPLDVVHAYERPAYGDAAPLLLPRTTTLRAEADHRAREAVRRELQRQPAGATLDIEVSVVEGPAAVALLAAGQGAALVVLGRRGGGAVVRGLRGSVSAQVLHGSWAPVVLVPPDAPRIADRGARSQVVVGLDGSAASQAALSWAVAQALEWGSVLVPVVVLSGRGSPPPALGPVDARAAHGLAAEVWHRVRDAGGHALEVHPEFRQGLVVRELLDVPTADDLLVIGSRGRGAGQSLLLGSTSTRAAESCVAPVVVVREGQARRETQRRVAAPTRLRG